MSRLIWLCAIWSILAPIAQATEIEPNEPLVMRLIFEDCLGYIRDDTPPFSGLITGPAPPEEIANLATELQPHLQSGELLSPRYFAAWGTNEEGRYCMIRTVWSDPLHGTGLLGVDPDGFLKRVTRRAVAAGLTEYNLAETLSPVMTSDWHEPEAGETRPATIVLLPTDVNDDETLFDVGLILVSGPPKSPQP